MCVNRLHILNILIFFITDTNTFTFLRVIEPSSLSNRSLVQGKRTIYKTQTHSIVQSRDISRTDGISVNPFNLPKLTFTTRPYHHGSRTHWD